MKTIGIYPGNFQPAHRGHLSVYKKLRQLVGPEAFIATTSRTPTPDAPLNFGEKENIWVRHGIPASHVVKVENWQHPQEIFQKYSPKHTTVIFILNQREFEMLRLHADLKDNKQIWVDANGESSFFQLYKGNETNMEPFEKHGYVEIMDDNMIDGKPISTANVRKALGSPQYTDDQKKKFFRWVFGWFDVGLFQELTAKFKLAHSSSDTEQEPVAMPSLASLVRTEKPPQTPAPAPAADNKAKLQQTIKEIVTEMLEEFMPPPSMTPSGTDTSKTTDTGLPTNTTTTPQQTKADLLKQKASAEREDKILKADEKWKQADLKDKKFKILDKRKELDTLNKSISSAPAV